MRRVPPLSAIAFALVALSLASPSRAQCPGGGNCSGHGTCIPIANVCSCNPGYAGVGCSQCAPGYYGYPNCQPIPTCQNGGVFNTVTGRCDCPPGFAGVLCQYTNPPNCQLGDQGVCASCNFGYYGASCLPCLPSAANPCNGNGTCSQGILGTGACMCNMGFAGNACQYSRAITCNGAGDPTNAGGCNCDLHVTGTNCTQCALGYTGYPACNHCAPGYAGYPNCVHCRADFDGMGGVTVGDIFAFLAAFFMQNGLTGPGHSADFNNDNLVSVTDIFAFLAAWFAGCP
jgi:hypothetical protein